MKLVKYFVAIATFVLLLGCGGFLGGGSTTVGSANNFSLKPEVVELDKTGAVVTVVTPTTVDLTGAPVLSPGQVLIHNELGSNRFLRKVVSSVVVGGTTTVTTSDATVEDVFDKANILLQSPISPDDLANLTPAQTGVTFSSGGKGRAPGNGGTVINFSNCILKDDALNAIVQIDGSITISAGIETIFKKNGLSVDEFQVAPFANISGTLTAKGKASGSFVKEIPLSYQAEIPVTPLGPLGINTNIQLMMRVEGIYSIDGQFTVSASVSAKAGVHYSKSTGWGLINQFDKNLTIKPPKLRASLDMGISLVRPKIGADILGIGEVHVTADVVKVEGKITAQTVPVPGFWVECFGDFGFTAGGSVKLGPLTLWNESKDFDLANFSIIQPFLLRTLSPTDTYIAYADMNFTHIRAIDGDGNNDRILVASPTFVFAPTVSQTGKLAFAKFNANNKAEIWTANANGTGQQKVTDGTLSANHLAWNPSGTEIAFDATGANNIKQVYVVHVSTGAIRQMTITDHNSRVPTWSADGSRIYFENVSSTGSKVIARTDFIAQTYDLVLSDDVVDYAEPSLSSDGLHLVCLMGGSEIVLADEFGKNRKTIISDSHVSRPSFSPDGQRLVMQYNDIGTITVITTDLKGNDQQFFSTGQQPNWGLSH
jgi:WD40 repeat protein